MPDLPCWVRGEADDHECDDDACCECGSGEHCCGACSALYPEGANDA